MGPLTPYLFWIKLVAIVGAVAGAFFFGQRTERNSIEAADARDERVAQAAYAASQKAIADNVGKTDGRQNTITHKLETIVREVPVYRDCVNTPDVVQLLDDARANRATSVGDNPSPVPAPRADVAP